MKTVSIKWGGNMDANQVHPSGLLTEEQKDKLKELMVTGVPSLVSYAGVFFAVIDEGEEEEEVVTFPLEMLSGTTESFTRVLRVITPHVDERVPVGGISINVVVSINGISEASVFDLWYVGRQLMIPDRVLVEVQNHMHASANALDEQLIQQLLTSDYKTIIGDSNPFLPFTLYKENLMSDSKKPPVKINLPQPEVTTLNAYRPNPVRDNADNELRSELYSRFLLPGETLEECEARMNKDLRESRKASLRLLSEKSGMVKPGVFRKRKVKERSEVAGSVTMKFLLDNGFTQEKPLNIVLSRIDQVVAQGRLHIIVSPTAKDGYRTVVTRSEPCLVDTFGVYFILMPVNVENDSVSCQQSNVLDDLVRSHTVHEDQAFDVIVIPMHLPLRAYKSLSGTNKDMDNWVQEMDALIEQDVLSRARHLSAWEEVRNKPNYPEELQNSVSLASDDFVEGMEMVGQPTNRDLLFGSQADEMYVPELVERIKESCKDKPVVVVTPRRPRFPSFFAGNVAMDSEADVVFSINNTVFSGDTHLAIHQPKKRPEGISGVQLKQTPKRVFVQLGNGAVYFAANHQHAEEVHRVIIDAVKPIRNNKS